MKTKCEYSGTLFIISRKYFSVFRGPHLPLDTPFWTRCFPLVMQSRKAGFPFATRARKREPCLQRYVSRMTRAENFLSQFFSKFFWKPLFSPFYGTLFIISRKYFFNFRSPHSTPTHRYTILDSRLLPCNFRSESFSIRTSKGRAPASELVLQRGSLPSEIATAGLFLLVIKRPATAGLFD